MYSRNLFVLDFARRFFVSCTQISEAYAVRTLMKFGGNWRKIGRKGKCRKDSESTFFTICSQLFTKYLQFRQTFFTNVSYTKKCKELMQFNFFS